MTKVLSKRNEKFRVKSFTAIEMTIAMLVLSFVLSLLYISYSNLIRFNLAETKILNAVNNTDLSMENVWRQLKYGTDFSWSNGILSFNDRTCVPQDVYLDSQNHVLYYGSTSPDLASPLTDSTLIKINSFNVSLNGTSSGPYYSQTSVKAITLDLVGQVTGLPNKNLNYQIVVAPINSALRTNPCSP